MSPTEAFGVLVLLWTTYYTGMGRTVAASLCAVVTVLALLSYAFLPFFSPACFFGAFHLLVKLLLVVYYDHAAWIALCSMYWWASHLQVAHALVSLPLLMVAAVAWVELAYDVPNASLDYILIPVGLAIFSCAITEQGRRWRFEVRRSSEASIGEAVYRHFLGYSCVCVLVVCGEMGVYWYHRHESSAKLVLSTAAIWFVTWLVDMEWYYGWPYPQTCK